MIASAIVRNIRDIVGAEYVLDSDLDRFGYSYDASFVPLFPANLPDLVVRPLTTGQVSQVMKLANEHNIPVTPRGAASGRTGGSIPLQGGISLSLERMNKVIELDEKNMMITVEAGVLTGDIYNLCARKGLFYPPDPASYKFSTIGGNIAEDAGGMRAVKYGVTHNFVMGLEVVLADGTVIHTGGKSIKNVTGYNLTQLFTGSEGTLGVVTKAILRLIPMPKYRNTLQLIFSSLDGACATIHQMLQSGVVPASAELMDRTCLNAISRNRKMEFPEKAEACIVTEVDGAEEYEIKKQAEQIEAIARKNDVIELRVAKTAQEADEIWAIRRALSPAVGALAPDRVSEDISVPRNEFPEIVRQIRQIAGKYNLAFAVYGHAGDGNLHPSILCDMSDPEQAPRVHAAVEEIFAATLALGGTLSGEHGIGITKQHYIKDALSEAGVNTLKAVKQSLDPKGILNPGKMW
ncbi:FAD-binding oxidoreductase [Acetonema longum]|uniref:FAD linked oxidase domain-containing protein n=1 Tax=Acetonema longum DSM 6540 TaxID=1009370 RepID=F7NHV0_9FIRM|nr:FAD-linked oxidase C-terminal domain-containing protein [Acetonema longum]EGO64475.1 FAD linked oxidase domain-containing protein [Acetonema longum DSM 6540]